MTELLYACLAGFGAGVIGAMGMGGGGVLILYLTLLAEVGQLDAQGINLLFFLPIAVFSLLRYRKEGLLHLKKSLPFIGFGLLGCLPGYLIAHALPTKWLSILFGGGLVLLGLWELFRKEPKKQKDQTEKQ